MGTRHLIAVQLDGEYKVAQYGQWDGYPDGQGVDILAFLKMHNGPDFVAKIRQCHFASDQEVEETWEEFGVNTKANGGFVDYQVAQAHDEKYPTLSRDAGANILPLIKLGEGRILLRDSIDFAADSLFCEWAYVIDLDKNLFEVYKGFNKAPLHKDERFANFSTEKAMGKQEYYPVKLAARWELDNLPSEEEFLAAFKEKDEDEEE